jgi:Bacterial extracellular solute-binding proteins, family 3
MTSRRSAAMFAAGLLVVAGLAKPACGDEVLSVCLDANVSLWSTYDGPKGGDFDWAVADAVAKRIGRQLAVQWFEIKPDPDDSTTVAANALLSDHRCRLVGGYPLVESALGKPGMKSARMPDFVGARPIDRGRSIELGTVVPSRAYHFAALTVVLGGTAASARITDLANLEGVKLGVESGTLADAVLMLFGDGRFANQITHIAPGRGELLSRLEQGQYDATLVELRRFDAYRGAHPGTKLTPSGYYFPIGFNIGFVGLSADRDLIEQVDRAIADMLKEDALYALARTAGVTYLPPRQPNVSPDVTFSELRRN